MEQPPLGRLMDRLKTWGDGHASLRFAWPLPQAMLFIACGEPARD